MKILCFSDWRVQSFEMIQNMVNNHNPDVILYAGDDLTRLITPHDFLVLRTPNHFVKLKYPEMEPIIKEQKKIFTPRLKEFLKTIKFQENNVLYGLDIPFYYVNGNDDFLLYREGAHYLQINSLVFLRNDKRYTITETPKGKITIKEGYCRSDLFAGIEDDKTYTVSSIECGIYVPITPSFGDSKIRIKDEEVKILGVECKPGLKSDIKNKPDKYAEIYLSHVPPIGTLDLSVRFGMKHIGSKKLLDAVKKHKPKLVICGHSHIWGGNSRKIGDTLVINVSSQDRDGSIGNYALVDTDDWSADMKTVEDKTTRSIRGLSTIRTYLKRKKIDLIRNYDSKANIDKCDELILALNPYTYRRTPGSLPKIIEEVEKVGINTNKIRERSDSFEWDYPKITRKITINPDEHAFVDVETGLANGDEPGKLWLIGILHNGDLRQFLFPTEKNDFFDYILQNRINSFVSWTRYDHKALNPILEKAKIKVKYMDACQRTSNCVIWHNYSLHELYNALFPEKQTPDLIPGYVAGLYADHVIISGNNCKYCPPKEEMIERIKERNREDLLQMVEICRKLYSY